MRLQKLTEKRKLNYTGIFFKNGTHMTWHYGFPLERPDGVSEGDTTKVKVIGEYEDDQVKCLVVEWENHKKQPNDKTLLHITTEVRNGGKPVMSGQRATKYGYEKVKPYYLDGVWK